MERWSDDNSLYLKLHNRCNKNEIDGINCQTRFVPDSSKIELGKYGDPWNQIITVGLPCKLNFVNPILAFSFKNSSQNMISNTEGSH